MSELDTLTEQFEKLLNGVRTQYSLDEWRDAYRKIIYFASMKLLTDFPEIMIGPPSGTQPDFQRGPVGGAPGGDPKNPIIAGQPPPYRPSGFCVLVCTVAGS